MIKINRICATLAMITSIAFVATACGGAGEAESKGQTNVVSDELAAYYSPPTTLRVDKPLSQTLPKDKYVAYISAGRSYDTEILSGLTAAGEVLGWKVKAFTFNFMDPQTVSSVASSALADGADALAFNVTQSALYASSAAAARAKGVPVFDLLTANPPTEGVTPVLPAKIAVGEPAKVLAKAILADATSKGTDANVLQVTIPVFSAVLGPIKEGLKNATSGCKACTLETLEIAAAELDSQVPSKVVSYLQSHPKVNYLFFDAASSSQGVANAIRAAGLPVPPLYSVGGTDQSIQELSAGADGNISAISGSVEGWILADSIARHFTKDQPVWSETTPPFMIMNNENAKGLTKIPEMPSNYKDEFKKLWGLG